jgi:hypothetical protein
MSTVSLYHNDRVDGGKRTGLEINGQRAFEQYVPGGEERDPAIRWYLDVDLPAAKTPMNRRESALWLRTHHRQIEEVVTQAKKELGAGYDADGLPWLFNWESPEGVIQLKVSAQRRYSAQNIAHYLDEFLRKDWKSFLKQARSIAVET